MTSLFYVSSAIAIIAAAMVITRANAMHALLYLVVMLLAVASVFWTLGAPFIAALQIVIYAGAIMVLFVFVIMILNLGEATEERERGWLSAAVWVLPVLLAAALLGFFVYALAGRGGSVTGAVVGPKAVGMTLFTDYLIGVELASLLLLAALVAGYHFGAIPARLEIKEEPHAD